MNSNEKNFFYILFTAIGVIFILSLISEFYKGFRKTTNSELVSEEGKIILQDIGKRKKLREAVNHYHKEGNWDKLKEVV